MDEAQAVAREIFRESPIAVRPLTSGLGAEVVGATAIEGNPAWLAKILNQLWFQYGILLFRDCNFSEAEQVAFSSMFGELEVHGQHLYNSKDHPQLLFVTNRKDLGLPPEALNNGDLEWHTDQTYLPRPALGSMLYAVEVPPVGGNTYWADTRAAYDRLPDTTKQRIATLKAVHDYHHVNTRYGVKANAFQRQRSALAETHPVVRTHPVTLRKGLYLASTLVSRVEGLTETDSEALLTELYAAMTAPELVYEHQGRPGDAVLWDNARVIHRRDKFPAKNSPSASCAVRRSVRRRNSRFRFRD